MNIARSPSRHLFRIEVPSTESRATIIAESPNPAASHSAAPKYVHQLALPRGEVYIGDQLLDLFLDGP
jgi:hypothetical protein